MNDIEEAREALRDYLGAQRTYYAEQARYGNLKVARGRLLGDMEALEAECVVNGEATGNNAEARKASLLVAMREKVAYLEAMEAVQSLDRDIAKAEAEMDEAANEMRRCRLIVELITAVITREAAAEGGRGMERKVSHVR